MLHYITYAILFYIVGGWGLEPHAHTTLHFMALMKLHHSSIYMSMRGCALFLAFYPPQLPQRSSRMVTAC